MQVQRQQMSCQRASSSRQTAAQRWKAMSHKNGSPRQRCYTVSGPRGEVAPRRAASCSWCLSSRARSTCVKPRKEHTARAVTTTLPSHDPEHACPLWQRAHWAQQGGPKRRCQGGSRSASPPVLQSPCALAGGGPGSPRAQRPAPPHPGPPAAQHGQAAAGGRLGPGPMAARQKKAQAGAVLQGLPPCCLLQPRLPRPCGLPCAAAPARCRGTPPPSSPPAAPPASRCRAAAQVQHQASAVLGLGRRQRCLHGPSCVCAAGSGCAQRHAGTTTPHPSPPHPTHPTTAATHPRMQLGGPTSISTLYRAPKW